MKFSFIAIASFVTLCWGPVTSAIIDEAGAVNEEEKVNPVDATKEKAFDEAEKGGPPMGVVDGMVWAPGIERGHCTEADQGKVLAHMLMARQCGAKLNGVNLYVPEEVDYVVEEALTYDGDDNGKGNGNGNGNGNGKKDKVFNGNGNKDNSNNGKLRKLRALAHNALEGRKLVKCQCQCIPEFCVMFPWGCSCYRGRRLGAPEDQQQPPDTLDEAFFNDMEERRLQTSELELKIAEDIKQCYYSTLDKLTEGKQGTVTSNCRNAVRKAVMDVAVYLV